MLRSFCFQGGFVLRWVFVKVQFCFRLGFVKMGFCYGPFFLKVGFLSRCCWLLRWDFVKVHVCKGLYVLRCFFVKVHVCFVRLVIFGLSGLLLRSVVVEVVFDFKVGLI